MLLPHITYSNCISDISQKQNTGYQTEGLNKTVEIPCVFILGVSYLEKTVIHNESQEDFGNLLIFHRIPFLHFYAIGVKRRCIEFPLKRKANSEMELKKPNFEFGFVLFQMVLFS